MIRRWQLALMIVSMAPAMTFLQACSSSSSSKEGRPAWLNELSDDFRYGYGMSLAVKDPGTLATQYRFAGTSGAIQSDERTHQTENVVIGRRMGHLAKVASYLPLKLEDAIDMEVDTASAEKLFEEQLVYLSNGDEDPANYKPWPIEKAFLFYKTIEGLPSSSNKDQGIVSVFLLSSKPEVRQIIELPEPPLSLLGKFPGAKVYKISGDAFDFTNVKELFGPNVIKAKFFDNQVFKEYVAQFLYDEAKLTELLEKRYGYRVAFGVPETRYQPFEIEELIQIICIIEDLPPFFKPIPRLTTLSRRHDADPAGHSKSMALVGEALEIHWYDFHKVTLQEFQANLVSRLAAAWYRYTLDRQKIAEWEKLSGWKVDGSGYWKPARTDNIVSDRGVKSPEDDFAESVAHYVVFPMNLLQKAKEKYDLIFSIMDGYQYRITAAQEHQFQVISANPDMTAPVVNVGSLEVDLFINKDGYYTVKVRLIVTDDISGVAGGDIEIFAENYPKHKARGGFQKTGRKPGEMEAVMTISRHAEKGKWLLGGVRFYDHVRNTARYTSENMGWDLFLPDNGYPVDKEPPTIDLSKVKLWHYFDADEGFHEIYAEMPAWDALSTRLYGTLSAAPQKGYDYAWGEFLGYHPEKRMMYFMMRINEYQTGGTWNIYYAGATDELCNGVGEYLLETGRQITFEIDNAKEDSRPPKIQADLITLDFTDNDPIGHNGSYSVTVFVPVRDDLAGTASVSATVMSPSGQLWSGGASVPRKRGIGANAGSSNKPSRKPQGWGKPPAYGGSESVNDDQAVVEVSIYLPAHVEGGNWILASVSACDRALNCSYVDLTRRGISISQ